MGADRGVSSQKREPNGNHLALEYLRSQCGSLFRRGFRLTLHRQQLYVRTAGTKVPLRLDVTASWQQVQERCAALQGLLAEGPYDSAAWLGRIEEKPRARKKPGQDLEDLVELWRRRKLAEGCNEATFRDAYEPYLRRLDPRRPLSDHSILQAIECLPSTSPRRRRVVRFYRQVAQAAGAPWNGALLDSLQGTGRVLPKRETPFLSDEQIVALVEALRVDGRLGLWRVVACLAVYGLRPWEAWVAEPAPQPDCLWIPRGKKNSAGTSPPRIVPPFHRDWIRHFRMADALSQPLPAITPSMSAGGWIGRNLSKKGYFPQDGKRYTAYAFRHAYARRIHGPRYRVTDTHGALFMGHTVAMHNATYRRWIEGSEDPLAAYGFGVTSPDDESAGPLL
jgi:hypothetical protein